MLTVSDKFEVTDMKTIWKYTLEITDSQGIEMPKYAKILSVGNQHESLCLWVEVEPLMPKEGRRIVIIGTGHDMPSMLIHYIGSVVINQFVWHVYEAKQGL